MNKHINSFNNQLLFSKNIDNIEKPSVTYIKDLDVTIFKSDYHQPTEDKYKARVGDLVFLNDMIYTEDIEGDKPLYMDPRDSRISMMMENDTCLGVVVSLPSYGEDDMIRIVSLDYMDYNQPADGNSKPISMMWGKADTTVTDLSAKDKILAYTPGTTTLVLSLYSYFGTDGGLIDSYIRSEDVRLSYDYYAGLNSMVPSPYTNSGSKNSVYYSNSDSILSDGLCGSENTDKIVAMSTAEVGSDSYNNTQDVYPAAMCCATYHRNILQDDYGLDATYYLPSIAELGLTVARIEEVNFARAAVGYSPILNIYLWSSSLCSSNYAWDLNLYLSNYFGYCDISNKRNNGSVLAFVAL